VEELAKYRRMKASGGSASVVYRTAKDDGADEVTAIRMLRSVFSLSLVEAKEAILLSEPYGQGLSEQQKGLIEPIEEALKLEGETG
jgi:ribosomal protein L7/L12